MFTMTSAPARASRPTGPPGSQMSSQTLMPIHAPRAQTSSSPLGSRHGERGRSAKAIHDLCQLAQNVVSGQMPVVIVDSLEEIDVEHQERQGPIVAARSSMIFSP